MALSVVAIADTPADSVPESETPRTWTTTTFPAKAVAGSTFNVPVGTEPLKLGAQGNKRRATLPANPPRPAR